jgi:hypothetical protein
MGIHERSMPGMEGSITGSSKRRWGGIGAPDGRPAKLRFRRSSLRSRPMRARWAICEGSSPGDPSFDGRPGRVDDRSTKARCPEIEATLPGPRAMQDPRSRPRGSTCPSSMAGIEGSWSRHRAFGVRLPKLRCPGAPLTAPAAHAGRLDLRALEARRSSLSRTIDEGSKSSQPTLQGRLSRPRRRALLPISAPSTTH